LASGDFGRYRRTTARQSQYHRMLFLVESECLGEFASGFGADC